MCLKPCRIVEAVKMCLQLVCLSNSTLSNRFALCSIPYLGVSHIFTYLAMCPPCGRPSSYSWLNSAVVQTLFFVDMGLMRPVFESIPCSRWTSTAASSACSNVTPPCGCFPSAFDFITWKVIKSLCPVIVTDRWAYCTINRRCHDDNTSNDRQGGGRRVEEHAFQNCCKYDL